MWKNQFTPGAQDALCLAQAAAEELGHSYVGSEHLLLGLLREEGTARRRSRSRRTGCAGRSSGWWAPACRGWPPPRG